MNILVTGASGFIGSAFLHRFAASNNVSLYGVGRQQKNDFPPAVRYSVLALDELEQLDFMPDVVIHAAGRASPWGTAKEYYRDNVETTQHVLNFCKRRGKPRLIFISSAAVYYCFGHQFNLCESQPVGPAFTSRYGYSKYQAERLVAGYCGEKTIVRPCAVFGCGDRLLFPPLIAAARKKRLVRLLTKEGDAQADIMHVDTLCDYLMSAATHTVLRPCYNLSGGRPVECQSLLNEVLQHFEIPLPDKTIRLSTAMHFASLLELFWRCLPLAGEPPITRFGVAVFGYSSTLDVTNMLEDFGPPSAELHQSLREFLQACKARGL